MSTFLPAMCPAFFMRVSPASRNAKPACMNMTSTAVMTTQIVDAATRRSCFDIEFLQWCAGPVVDDVVHGRDPAQSVAGLVAAARRVDDPRLDAPSDADCLDLLHRYAAISSRTVSVGTVAIVCRMRPAIRYGSPSEFGRRSSRYPR